MFANNYSSEELKDLSANFKKELCKYVILNKLCPHSFSCHYAVFEQCYHSGDSWCSNWKKIGELQMLMLKRKFGGQENAN